MDVGRWRRLSIGRSTFASSSYPIYGLARLIEATWMDTQGRIRRRSRSQTVSWSIQISAQVTPSYSWKLVRREKKQLCAGSGTGSQKVGFLQCWSLIALLNKRLVWAAKDSNVHWILKAQLSHCCFFSRLSKPPGPRRTIYDCKTLHLEQESLTRGWRKQIVDQFRE